MTEFLIYEDPDATEFIGKVDDLRAEGDITQDLAAEETNPAGGRRDASQEEIQHLIHHAGWNFAHVDAFGAYDSTLNRRWKEAEAKNHWSYEFST